MNEFINKYKNTKFDQLTVIGPEELVLDQEGNIVQRNVYCNCDCGKKWVLVGISDLLNGRTTSCGCMGSDTFVRVVNSGNCGHGDSKSGPYFELYKEWANKRYYTMYGGKDKNIEFYSEWNKYENFKEWALSNGWCIGMSLKRYDYRKGYIPDNCYFEF